MRANTLDLNFDLAADDQLIKLDFNCLQNSSSNEDSSSDINLEDDQKLILYSHLPKPR